MTMKIYSCFKKNLFIFANILVAVFVFVVGTAILIHSFHSSRIVYNIETLKGTELSFFGSYYISIGTSVGFFHFVLAFMCLNNIILYLFITKKIRKDMPLSQGKP